MESKSLFEMTSPISKEEIDGINSGTLNRIKAMSEFTGKLARILESGVQIDLKVPAITSDAVESIQKAAKTAEKNENNELTLRQLEAECIKELYTLYTNLGPSPKTFGLRTLLPTNANKISNEIEQFMRQNYIPILNTYAGTTESPTINKQSGTELLHNTYNLMQHRVAEIKPKPGKDLAIHEVFIGGDQIKSQEKNFYDGNMVHLSKSSIPQTMGGMLLYAGGISAKHSIEQQGLALAMSKEAAQKSRALKTYSFQGQIDPHNVKCIKVYSGEVWENPNFASIYEHNYNSAATQASISPSALTHIYVVAPGDEPFGQIPKDKHQLFFYSEDRAREFIEQAKKHPYWYDEKRGWNLEGWTDLMKAKDHLITNLEQEFTKEQIARSYLIDERFTLPKKLDAPMQELQALKTIIEMLQKAKSDEEVVEILKEAILSLREQPIEEGVELQDFSKTTYKNMIQELKDVTVVKVREKLAGLLQTELDTFTSGFENKMNYQQNP